MLKSLIKFSLLLAPLLLAHPATAAKFAVKGISGEQWCWKAMQQAFPFDSLCSTYPVGTVSVVITPEPGELPIKCYDSGNGGNFCMYSADFYIAAHYRGKWFTKSGYAWTEVDISKIPATTAWPPWSGTGSMGYEIGAGEINLNTSQVDSPPEGFEVYVGITPAGSTVFAPNMVTKVYPVSTP
jgi:hypothetical protein